VTEKGKILPKDVIECWPEIFGEVKLHVLPMRYLQSVIVNFKDGKIWEIKVTTRTRNNGWESFENSLSELFKSYEKRIDNIDFKLDSARVKKDIEQSTKRFLRKKKL
jgi:hypothetical protein